MLREVGRPGRNLALGRTWQSAAPPACTPTTYTYAYTCTHPPIHPPTTTPTTHARLHAETGEGWRSAGGYSTGPRGLLGLPSFARTLSVGGTGGSRNFSTHTQSHHASMDVDTNECTRGYAQVTHTCTRCIRERRAVLRARRPPHVRSYCSILLFFYYY